MYTIRAHLLPSVSEYDEALKLYEKSFEDANGWRRFKKRDGSKLIRRTEDGCVTFRYHRADLVKWVSQDYVIVHLHDSVSSRTFINAFLPRGLYAQAFRGSTYVTVLSTDRSYRGLKALEFKRTDGVWTLQNPGDIFQHTEYVYDPKAAAAVRKKVKPLIEELQALVRLRQVHIPVWQRAGDRLSVNSMDRLRRLLRDGEVPLGEAAQYYEFLSDATMMHAYVLEGAVKRKLLPIGSVLAKRSKYDFLNSWAYAPD